MSTSVDVSVVIVNYNVCEFLIQALGSVEQASSNLSVETWVVDNNSIDDSVKVVAAEFPEAHVIANDSNVGFGSANNQAILKARGEFILILNPDTILQEDSLDAMVAFMRRHDDCGALGCQILNPDGSFAPESRRSFPTPEIAFYRMTGLGTLFPGSRRFGRYNMTYLPADQEAEVDALSGSCMMVRRSALLSENGAGLFDEDFFMYGEDLDLCFRIQQKGWKIWYTPSTQIIHYKGESTKKGDTRYVRLFYGAMLLFIEKHLEQQHSRFFAFFLRAGIMVRAGASLITNMTSRVLPLLADFSSVYASVVGLGFLRYQQSGSTLSNLFFATTAPAYAAATVVAIAVLGGYRRGAKSPSTPVFSGLLFGFGFVASLSFFIQEIAFSRLVVMASFPVALIFLLAWRYVAHRKSNGPRRAILVGGPKEAARLRRLLAGHPRPAFRLKGYVSDDSAISEKEELNIPRIGKPSSLRDLVRIRGFDDIVFAAGVVSNQKIMSTMRDLNDLSVQFRILSEGRDHVIGKSTVNHLSVSALSADVTELVQLRSGFSRRSFELLISTLAIPLIPMLWLASRLFSAKSAFRMSSSRLFGVRHVFSGKKSLVGYNISDEKLIPENWNLRSGVFSVTNSMSAQELESGEKVRAYWYYVTHQSPGLDIEIILAAFRNPTTDTPV